MSDTGLLQTLIVGHLWQSVILAAVLASVLIFGRKMRGATRYSLAGAAFAASLALPLAAFIPGDTIATMLIEKLGVPAPAARTAETATPATPAVPATAANEQVPDWIANLAPAAVNAIAPAGTPMSETPIGKLAVNDGAPAWALNLGGSFLRNAVNSPATPKSADPPKAAPKPFFTLPEIKLPDFNLPDLTLPLLMVWIAGALMLLVRTGRDLIAVERLVARARPAELPQALKERMRGVRVGVSAAAPGPMAAGLFRPCVVLPESISLSSPGMAALLEHERAHIRRRDMITALAQRILLALLWWSPALYWISRRIDEEREVACDEAAVERTGDAKAFARSLTTQAENQLWARAPRLAVGAIGPRSQFGRRIRRLIDLAKSGGSPAKYSGRLAFAGLALAVATAAMLTPRFDASAQQTKNSPPVDETLAGGPHDLLSPQEAREPREPRETREQTERARDAARAARDAARAALGRSRDHDLDGDIDDQDYALLGDDIHALLGEISVDLKDAFSGLSPELETELNGLSTEMAALGVEISASVNQQVMAQMPEIMAQVREALEAEGIDIGDIDNIEFSDEDRQQLREALQEARDQIHEQLGPEMREEIREAIEEARREIAEHRDEIAAAMEQSKAGMSIAREAMAKARAEIDAARARGDFDKFKNYDWKNGKYAWKDSNFDFDFDKIEKINKDVEAKLRAKGIDVRTGGPIRIRGSHEDQLFRAAQRCDEKEVTRLIVDEKADVNRAILGDGTPLIAASRAGCVETVRALLNAGADPNGSSVGDGNPLIVAAQRGKMDVARLLIDRGANVNAAVIGDGNPLIAAAQRGSEDIARLLIDRGANVNAYVEGDETPLINAAEQGRLAIVRLMVDRGAKVNLAYNVETWRKAGKTTELRSPLNMAMRHDHDDVVAYLKSKGAVESPKPAN